MIILDTETTGLNPHTHALLSIGAVDFNNPTNTFYGECQLWPGAAVSPEALAVNGFTLESIRDTNKPTLDQLLQEFFGWAGKIAEPIIAGQNIRFDLGFLTASAKRAGMDWPLGRQEIELQTACYLHHVQHKTPAPTFQGKFSLRLDAIAAYVGLPPEPRPHTALQGASYAAECFSRLLFNESRIAPFQSHPVKKFS